MTVKEIHSIARKMGVKAGKMKKADKEETSVLSKYKFQNILRQRVLLKNIGAGHQVSVLKNATSE